MQESCKNIYFFFLPPAGVIVPVAHEREILTFWSNKNTLGRQQWKPSSEMPGRSCTLKNISAVPVKGYKYTNVEHFFFFWKNALGCRSETDRAASSRSQVTASQSAMGSVKNWAGAGGGDLCTATAKHSQQVISPLHVSPTSAAPQRRPSGSHVISKKLSQRANNGGVHSDPTPVFPKVKKIWIRNPIIVAQNKCAIESLIKSPVCFFFPLCTVPE